MTTTVYRTVNDNGDELGTLDESVADFWSTDCGYRVRAEIVDDDEERGVEKWGFECGCCGETWTDDDPVLISMCPECGWW